MLRILLAEDNDLVRWTLATLLQSRGYTVDQATDGRQAVRCFYEHPPDVVLMDVHMPGMNGLEACRLLRARSRVPILMISTNDQAEIQEQVAECGADAFLPKPLEFKDLLRWIQRFDRGRGRVPEAVCFGLTSLTFPLLWSILSVDGAWRSPV